MLTGFGGGRREWEDSIIIALVFDEKLVKEGECSLCERYFFGPRARYSARCLSVSRSVVSKFFG